MTARQCDIAILGGGLAGGLIALALARGRPDLSLLLVEQEETLGGNHIWSFFGADVGRHGRDLLAPLVEKGWPGYSVRFPGYIRHLDTSYYAMTSARLDATLRRTLLPGAILTGSRVLAASACAVTLADGTRIEAGGVIDARGIRNLGHLTGGWQKFLGRRLKLTSPHGLESPIVMDASVEQTDGYRFIYALPFTEDEIFVEDTYYSDGPALDCAMIGDRIHEWVAAQGWQIAENLGEEQGILPVVAGGDLDGFLRATGKDIARAGTRAGLFHPVTSYSVPYAVRYALAIAEQIELDGDNLAMFSEKWSRKHWQSSKFYRSLSAMLFAASEPAQRYRVLERFYRLDQRLIERFYAGRSTVADKFRLIAGKPPVPLARAIGVLTGLGAKPQPLNLAGMRK